MAIEGIEDFVYPAETREVVSELLVEPVESVVDTLMTRLELTRADALAVLLFDVANRINWRNPDEAIQITIRTGSSGGHGRLRATRFGNNDVVPLIVDHFSNRVT